MEQIHAFDRLIICNTKGERTMLMTCERERTVLAVQELNRSKEGRHLSWKQRRYRPRFEDVVSFLLDEDAAKSALIFVERLRADGMKVNWTAVNTWKVTYKREHVCNINIENGTWTVNYANRAMSPQQGYVPYCESSIKRLCDTMKSIVTGTHKAYQAS